MPGLQMTGLLGIMLISVLIQVRFLPWNAPLVNVADAASSGFLLMLGSSVWMVTEQMGEAVVGELKLTDFFG